MTTTMKRLACATIATFALTTGTIAFEQQAEDKNKFAEKIKAQDWAAAELALVKTNFTGDDEIFAKVNMAFLYATTGRIDEARTLYTSILKGRRNDFAMTVSGQPRKIKYIARDGLKMIGS